MISSLFFFICGVVLAAVIAIFLGYSRKGGFEKLAQEIIQKAELEAETQRRKGELDLLEQKLQNERAFEKSIEKERQKQATHEDHLRKREELLETRLRTFEQKSNALDLEKKRIADEREQLKIREQKLEKSYESLSKMSAEEAKKELMAHFEKELVEEKITRLQSHCKQCEEEAEKRAQEILTTALGRCAIPCVTQVTVLALPIPDDEMKKRLIGREGRNIQALEKATGANLSIDDPTNSLVISTFDPTRQACAKKAIQKLLQDGRIHPSRIEEVVEYAEKEVEKEMHEAARESALRCGQQGLHPEILKALGSLKWRASFGQNLLDHALEVSHLLGLIAAELRLDIGLAKRIGLLHDIGKALSHENEGSHALVGRDFLLKWGESESVANGVACHHGEVAPITLEGSLCSAADALSAGRPGARIEAIEETVKRLRKLEELALSYEGVEKAYVLQAGKELRVILSPEKIAEKELPLIARNLSRKIKKEMRISGKIALTLIYEKRLEEMITSF